LYGAIIVTVLKTALAWWRAERATIALATLGLVVVTFGGWLIGGEYSMAALVWLYIGAMDRLAADAPRRRTRSVSRAPRFGHA
jgi:hypothetical protein